MKLFKSKNQKNIEVCKEIRSFTKVACENLSETQKMISDLQDDIKEFNKLSKRNLQLLDEWSTYLDSKVGDK